MSQPTYIRAMVEAGTPRYGSAGEIEREEGGRGGGWRPYILYSSEFEFHKFNKSAKRVEF